MHEARLERQLSCCSNVSNGSTREVHSRRWGARKLPVAGLAYGPILLKNSVMARQFKRASQVVERFARCLRRFSRVLGPRLVLIGGFLLKRAHRCVEAVALAGPV